MARKNPTGVSEGAKLAVKQDVAEKTVQDVRLGNSQRRVTKRRSPKLTKLDLIREQAMLDYITDPERRSLRKTYERDDRQYVKLTTQAAFDKWAKRGNWAEERRNYWRRVRRRLIEIHEDNTVDVQWREIQELTDVQAYLLEHIEPLRDKDGNVRRYPAGHPLDGLPMFPYQFENYEKVIGLYLKLNQHLMSKRGETTKRVEHTSGQLGDGSQIVTVTQVGEGTGTANLTQADLRAMARALLEQRQPELVLPSDTECGDDEDEEV